MCDESFTSPFGRLQHKKQCKGRVEVKEEFDDEVKVEVKEEDYYHGEFKHENEHAGVKQETYSDEEFFVANPNEDEFVKSELVEGDEDVKIELVEN